MKDFILLAPKTATQYQDMFWRIVEGQIFIGINYPTVFDGEEGEITALSNWLNTVRVHKHKTLNLTKTYSEDKYPTYDNYPQAINVDWIKGIPYDYDGVMGVPITILEKNLDNVEIYDARDYTNDEMLKSKNTQLIKDGDGTINGEAKYPRVLIKKNFEIIGTEHYLPDGKSICQVDNRYGNQFATKNKSVYKRILIKKNFEIEGLLYGEYTEIDGEYIKGHRPILNNKQMYSRALIRRKPE